MHIALLGPISPGALARHLDASDGRTAERCPDGYGTSSTAVARSLVEAGHHVTAISHRRGHGALRLTGPRLTVVQVPSRTSARAQALDGWRSERAQMVREVRRATPDVVHAHWTYEWALAAIHSGLPTVITVRDAPLTVLRYMPDPYRLLRAALAYRVRWAAGGAVLTAVSPYVAGAWKRQMLWTKRVTVVPNMMPEPVAVSGEKAAFPLLVEVADGGPIKNIRTLLRAFTIVRQTVPDAQLRLIGPGLGRTEPLASWARENGVAIGVTFLGRAGPTEVAAHLSAAWVHVHASLEESFGMTLLEAMSLNTAVVAGRSSGASPWVLAEGDAGVLVDVRDPAELARGVVALLADPARRARLASAGRERARALSSPAAVVEAYSHVYDAVRDTHGGRS